MSSILSLPAIAVLATQKEAGISESYRKAKLLGRSTAHFAKQHSGELGTLSGRSAAALSPLAVPFIPFPEHQHAAAAALTGMAAAPAAASVLIGGLTDHERRAAVAKKILANSKTAATHMIDPNFMYRKGGGKPAQPKPQGAPAPVQPAK